MKRETMLTIDIGTSSARAAVFQADGSAAGLSQIKYDVLRPAPFMEEQEPDAIRRAVYEVVQICLAQPGVRPDAVRGIVFSSQMYSVFPIDADGRPLCNSILWSDGRAEDEAAALRAENRHDALYRETGCPVNSIYPLSKILWLRDRQPDLCARAARFVSIKEYVLEPLISDWVTDYSMASGTGMFDGSKDVWSPLALETAGVAEDRLPRLVPGDQPLEFRNDELRRAWGLSSGVKVFSGGGDGPLANLGSGAFAPGDVNVDLGTSGALRVVADSPVLDSQGRLWRYSIAPGRWAFGGILSNVGNAWQWLASNIAAFQSDEKPEETVKRLSALAADVPMGAEGVYFLPYLRKARAPYWDDRLRGTVFGLTAAHDTRHLARAMLEAIAFDLAEIIDIASRQVAVSPVLILTGGLSQSVIVPQLLADVMNRDIVIPDHSEGSLAGAAIVGLKGAGLIDDFAFVRSGERPQKRIVSDRARHERYNAQRAKYASLVAAIRDITL